MRNQSIKNKSRYSNHLQKLNTTSAKFNNALNFRGEPFIPGQDELQRFAGQ